MPTASPTVPDVRKSVTVDAPVDRAFAVFVERPIEWWPADHVFVADRRSITIEPRAGGRYYETGADGTEIAWGTIVEFDAPRRIAMTWRVGAGWQPVPDDEAASVIEVEFAAVGPDRTEVSLTHAQLHRHGPAAARIHAALDGPSPGDTLAQFAAVVARCHPTAR